MWSEEAGIGAAPASWAGADSLTYCVLAAVLEAAGRREEAGAAWQKALDRYERKEIVPLARRVRSRLAALLPTQQ